MGVQPGLYINSKQYGCYISGVDIELAKLFCAATISYLSKLQYLLYSYMKAVTLLIRRIGNRTQTFFNPNEAPGHQAFLRLFSPLFPLHYYCLTRLLLLPSDHPTSRDYLLLLVAIKDCHYQNYYRSEVRKHCKISYD